MPTPSDKSRNSDSRSAFPGGAGSNAGPGVHASPEAALTRVLWAMLLLSTALKLYHVTAPALDWHSWKQTLDLAIARYLYRDGPAGLLLPREGLFLNLHPQSDVHFAEVPVYHALLALGYTVIGGEAEWVGRVWNLGFSLLGGAYLIRLGSGRLSRVALAVAVGVYAFSPMNLFFHRTVMTSVGMTALMIAALYHTVRWMETDRLRQGLLAGGLLAAASLFRPYALMLGVAVAWLVLRRRPWRHRVTPGTLAVAALSLAPMVAWQAHGYAYFAAHPDAGYNLNASSNMVGAWSILVEPGYYSKLWAILVDFTGAAVFGLLAVGAVLHTVWLRGRRPGSAQAAADWPDWLTGWCLAGVAYLALIRGGNWEHDYYQMPLHPPLAVAAGIGFARLWHWSGERAQPTGATLAAAWRRWRPGRRVLAVLAALALVYAVGRARFKYDMGLDSWHAGRSIAAVRQPGEYALVHEVSSLRYNQLLYYTGGKGWVLYPPVTDAAALAGYVEHGGRYLGITMPVARWDHGEWPRSTVRAWEAAGLVTPLASGTEPDRYGKPRHWATYRLNPAAIRAAANGH